MPADKFALRMQERLVEERKKQAIADRAEAEVIVGRIGSMAFAIEVKADQEGKLYGSVSSSDIVDVLAKEGITIQKHQVALPHAIKMVGVHTINLKLKEGVTTSFSLSVSTDGKIISEKTEANE